MRTERLMPAVAVVAVLDVERTRAGALADVERATVGAVADVDRATEGAPSGRPTKVAWADAVDAGGGPAS